MKIFQALKYYLTSVFTVIDGVNFYSIPMLIMNGQILLKTREGINYYVKSLMEIWTVKEVVLDKQYEVYKKLESSDIVIDIGAAIGEFTIYAALKAKSVFAFEANPDSVNRLKENIKLNNVNNIVVVQKRVNSINKIFNEFNIQHCNFLKVDCEGCEYAIFKNVSSDILNRIDYISMEVHFFDNQMKNSYKDMLALLKNHFEIIETKNMVHSNIAFIYAIRKMNKN